MGPLAQVLVESDTQEPGLLARLDYLVAYSDQVVASGGDLPGKDHQGRLFGAYLETIASHVTLDPVDAFLVFYHPCPSVALGGNLSPNGQVVSIQVHAETWTADSLDVVQHEAEQRGRDDAALRDSHVQGVGLGLGMAHFYLHWGRHQQESLPSLALPQCTNHRPGGVVLVGGPCA